MDPAQLIDLVISIAMIPLLFAVGYALTLVTLIVLNLFLHDDRDDHGEKERHSLSDLAGLAFGLNFLMTILWLVFFGLFCLARAASSPDVKARLPDSVSGLLLHSFLASWEFAGLYGIYVGFCIVIALVYYSVRSVLRQTWQAVRRMWQAVRK